VLVEVDPADSRAESRQAAEQTEVSFAGAELKIRVPQSNRTFRRGGQVQISLRVPLDSRVRTLTGSADVRTEGPLGELVLQSGSGDVEVAQAGLVQAETGSGDVKAGQVGEMRVTTGSGDVSAKHITSVASIRTASGDVNIEQGRGALRINTASGDVMLRSVGGQEANVHTASGDVKIGVPAGTGVWLDLNTVSGTTSSDLAMTDGPGEQPVLRLEVRTASGDISLRRVPAPAAAQA
jgi:DUF4097 and DUF4098 domain-containing protein YvlB